jgi:methyl-accepting chemotaxis protein
VDSIKRIIAAIQEIQGESKNIFDLLGFIKRIANQTTLLAFNAAIEAAHAGDSGRGFSIVAEEIRSLADNTNTNIKGIEKAARALLARINETAVISGKTGTGLEDIISQTRMNEDLAKQLNLAMQEQEKGAGEILKATQELVDITSEIKSSMMEQKTATDEFGRTLLKLRDLTRDKVTG